MRKKYFVFGFQKENVFVACWNGFLVNSCYFLALLNLSEKIMFEELRRSWRKTLMLLFVSFFFLNTLLFSKLESLSSKKEQKKKKNPTDSLVIFKWLQDESMIRWVSSLKEKYDRNKHYHWILSLTASVILCVICNQHFFFPYSHLFARV